MIRLGIFGGGQLAQMLTQSAVALGVETVIFDPAIDTPAGRYTSHKVIGDWGDPAALNAFASQCDIVTLENEFVAAAILADLESRGLPVFPTAATLAVIQDKLLQKERMRQAGLAVPPFSAVRAPDDVRAFAAAYGWPLVLKARRNGYDGYGNATLRHPEDIAAAWERLSARSDLLAEAWVPFVHELAVMIGRGRDGSIVVYPAVETVQRNHICHMVRAPAAIPPATAKHAAALAQQAVTAIDGIGIFGVELFALPDGQVLYNEIAPRPHNSGHYTIEGCTTSQFENHLRAVLGWPLGSSQLRAPAIVMVNLLGSRNGAVTSDVLNTALAVPGAHIHLYGKRQARIGRKMGHITALGANIAEAEAIALRAARLVNI
ncbi:5-(carboxyamino)imidazole ribonucleotide synthase [Candidatus Gracilibacteria bacterium]|nr:5-(carboxyamino)imidazole ribonucleotide synthase [Candidatus Gracilibacteria bacterium]